ncbi:MAG: hypothetical protein HYS12_01670 [Planctomycetes bacterium]|nr:hypothetical protein [Planctomycetota bacterium]
MTTLLDATQYRKEALVSLYRERWGVDISHPHCTSSASLYPRQWAA